ncbi:MAG: hypothetical protein ACFB10_01245 [Salibacteraceae bacterium]
MNLSMIAGPRPLMLALCAALLGGCGNSNQLDLFPELEVGHAYRMEIVKAKVDVNGSERPEVATVTEAVLTLNAGGDPSEGTVVYGKTVLRGENANQMLGKDWSESVDVYRDITLQLKFTREGTTELTNFEEVKATVIQRLMDYYKKSGQTMSQEQMASIQTQMDSSYDTPDKLMSSYFPGVMLYFNPPVRQMPKNQEVNINTQAPNPYGGTPFPMAGAFQCTVNDSMGIVEGKETIPDHQATHIIRSTYAEMAAKNGSNLDTNNIPPYSLNHDYVMHYDLDAGHLVLLRQTRNSNSGGMDQSNYTEVKL